jgi:hypothetical protein
LCVIDSTALTPASRQTLTELARKHRVPCVVLLFDVPFEVCLERDQQRAKAGGRSVGRPVIERQHQMFIEARAAIRNEGYDRVIELSDQDLSTVKFDVIFRPPLRVSKSAAPKQPPRADRPTPEGGHRASANVAPTATIYGSGAGLHTNEYPNQPGTPGPLEPGRDGEKRPSRPATPDPRDPPPSDPAKPDPIKEPPDEPTEPVEPPPDKPEPPGPLREPPGENPEPMRLAASRARSGLGAPS